MTSVIDAPIAAGHASQSPGIEEQATGAENPDLSGSASARTFSSQQSAQVPLLATKLYIPRTRTRFLARPRLIERLAASVRGPLSLLVAPAGWGKTTALSEWRASPSGTAWPAGWVSLAASDNDPVRFWTYVLSALNDAAPCVAAGALALLRASQPQRLTPPSPCCSMRWLRCPTR